MGAGKPALNSNPRPKPGKTIKKGKTMKVLNFDTFCNHDIWLCCDGKDLYFMVVHRKTLEECNLYNMIYHAKDSLLMTTKSWLDDNKCNLPKEFYIEAKNRIYAELEKEER